MPAVSPEAAYDSKRSVQRGRPEAVGDLPLQVWGHWDTGGHSKYNVPGGLLSSKDVFPHSLRAGWLPQRLLS